MNKDRFLLVFVFLIVVIASVGIITYFSQNAVESIRQTTIDRRNADVDNLSIIIKEANPHLVNKAISTNYLGMHSLVAILDSNGNVMTSTNNTILNNISLKKLDIFKQAINGEIGSKIETIGGTKMFVSYHAIQMPTTTWALLVIRPYDDSFSAYETAKSQVIVTVVLVTILVTIFGLYVTRAYKSINDLAKKLDIAIKELIQADKEKGEFASMVSHDLRTPAVVIKSYTGMLLDPKIYGSLNEDQEKAVQAISNSTQKLETLIDDIFDAYKLEMKSLK